MVERICILGSTGSIGCSALDVIAKNAERFSVSVLTANKNYRRLFQQCQEFRPELAIMGCEKSADKLKRLLVSNNLAIEVRGGHQAVNQAAEHVNIDTVIAAIVGAAGLLPTITAVKQSHKILLANKEALVMSGDLFMAEVKKHNAILLPVDSEHNAIFQSLPQSCSNARPNLNGVKEILLTGSGGPFLKSPIESLIDKTPDEACAHPNWNMGKKISVDSATMMNKGLELIEACYLFGVAIEQIKIIIHPQSIIHSMVSYVDGSVMAQMGNPDMKTPIAHCLAWPQRIDAGVKALDFYQLAGLQFLPPDFERFPCLALAVEAINKGKSAPCVLNAANEVAVQAFLNNEIKYTDIALIIKKTLSVSIFEDLADIAHVVEIDGQARELALSIIKEMT